MDMLPKDPVMLLSVVNTALRDLYCSLDEFCRTKDVEKNYIVRTLEKIDYKYDEKLNKFI